MVSLMVTMTDDPAFITVALPKEIVNKIDEFVTNSEGLYTSRPHVIKVALSKFFKNGGGINEGECKTG